VIYKVETQTVCFTVKDGYYNDELLKKLKNPPYSSIHTFSDGMDNYVSLVIGHDDDNININVLEHYLKFEKEKFVKEIIPCGGDVIKVITGSEFYVKGQILKNGIPLTNYAICLYGKFLPHLCVAYKSINDENGNYIFPDMDENKVYTLSFKDGDITYDTTFVLDENKGINFNIVGSNDSKDISTKYNLSKNYPNPFNPTTTIQYSIPKDEYVKIVLYDVTGKVVKELVNGYKSAGRYNVEFNASGYASGIYYYKIEAGMYKSVQKMMLMK